MPFWGRKGAAKVERDPRLIGRWDLDPSVASARSQYGNTTTAFEADGRLLYIVHLPQKDLVMILTWRTEGDTLVTDQPSHPREERTPYRLLDSQTLLLGAEGQASRHIRGSGSPFPGVVHAPRPPGEAE